MDTNEIPRRLKLDLMTPAELAIYNSILELGKLDSSDSRITTASDLLMQARNVVADIVDNPRL